MPNIQSALTFCKKPAFILSLILATFFLKGVFIATLFPMFTGQDEARHYNGVQFAAEPAEKTWAVEKRPHVEDKETFRNYNFSQEIQEVGIAADFDRFRHDMYDTSSFSDAVGYDGQNEALINSQPWQPYNLQAPADVAYPQFYHKIAAVIERALGDSNMLVRFFSVRIFSVFLATLIVLLAYLIARTVGFSEWASLALTALVAFQPKLSMYLSNVNYDALLLPLFSLFTYGAVLSLKKGLDWKNITLMIVAIALGIATKSTATVLLPVFSGLIFFHIYQTTTKKKNLIIYTIAFLLLLTAFNFVLPRIIGFDLISLISFKGSFSETMTSLGKYLDKSLTPGRFALSSRTYWGSLGWEETWLSKNFTDIIYAIEALAVVGLGFFFFSKKERLVFLPEKKYVVFFIGMLAALQLGIRLADWNIFRETSSLLLGTPGRYFLPNLTAHLILVFVGLGQLFRQEKYFRYALLTSLILMFAFSLHLIFNVVLPRYYL